LLSNILISELGQFKKSHTFFNRAVTSAPSSSEIEQMYRKR